MTITTPELSIALRNAGTPLYGREGLALLDDLATGVAEARSERRDRQRAAHEWADSYLAYYEDQWRLAYTQPDLVLGQSLVAWSLLGWAAWKSYPSQQPLPRRPETPRDAITVGCYMALNHLFNAVWSILAEDD